MQPLNYSTTEVSLQTENAVLKSGLQEQVFVARRIPYVFARVLPVRMYSCNLNYLAFIRHDAVWSGGRAMPMAMAMLIVEMNAAWMTVSVLMLAPLLPSAMFQVHSGCASNQ